MHYISQFKMKKNLSVIYIIWECIYYMPLLCFHVNNSLLYKTILNIYKCPSWWRHHTIAYNLVLGITWVILEKHGAHKSCLTVLPPFTLLQANSSVQGAPQDSCLRAIKSDLKSSFLYLRHDLGNRATLGRVTRGDLFKGKVICVYHSGA